eukprot:gene20011-25985_t
MLNSSIFFIFLCIISYVLINANYNKPPVKINVKPNFSKPLLALGAVGSLYLAKKTVIDGPVFSEKVDLTGKNVVITGANTGLGKETALKLASLGANTWLLCKSDSKGIAAVNDIKSKTNNQNVNYIQCDLSNRKIIDNTVNQLKSSLDSIDVLVNNAGVMAIPTRQLTADGFEAHIGINHLGHYVLTGQLLSLLSKKPNSRIINVSSQAHLFGNFKDRDDILLAKPNAYEPWPAYGNSKLANILYTRALAKRLANKENAPISLTCHPGVCRTELGRYIIDPDSIPKALQPIVGGLALPLLYFSKDATMGAQTQIYLSASSKIKPSDAGKFYDNSAEAFTSFEAQNAEEAEWLWKESERLTGLVYNI